MKREDYNVISEEEIVEDLSADVTSLREKGAELRNLIAHLADEMNEIERDKMRVVSHVQWLRNTIDESQISYLRMQKALNEAHALQIHLALKLIHKGAIEEQNQARWSK